MKNKEFKISTSLGTLYIVLAIIAWISSISFVRRIETASWAWTLTVILFTMLAVIFTMIAIEFGIRCFDGKDMNIGKCEECGEQINYYWFFGFYIGRHLCSKDIHKYRKGLTNHS